MTFIDWQSRRFPVFERQMHQRCFAVRHSGRLRWWFRWGVVPWWVPLPHGVEWWLHRKSKLSGKVPTVPWLQVDAWGSGWHIHRPAVHRVRYGAHVRHGADFGRWTDRRFFCYPSHVIGKAEPFHSVFHFGVEFHDCEIPIGRNSGEGWFPGVVEDRARDMWWTTESVDAGSGTRITRLSYGLPRRVRVFVCHDGPHWQGKLNFFSVK